MTPNVQKSPYEIIHYLPDGNVQINLDNILTESKIIHPNMPLIKLEGSHIDLIKILDISDDTSHLYIKIQEYETGREYQISHILDPMIKYFVWWLVSEDCMLGMLEDRVFRKINYGQELEFDFKIPVNFV